MNQTTMQPHARVARTCRTHATHECAARTQHAPRTRTRRTYVPHTLAARAPRAAHALAARARRAHAHARTPHARTHVYTRHSHRHARVVHTRAAHTRRTHARAAPIPTIVAHTPHARNACARRTPARSTRTQTQSPHAHMHARTLARTHMWLNQSLWIRLWFNDLYLYTLLKKTSTKTHVAHHHSTQPTQVLATIHAREIAMVTSLIANENVAFPTARRYGSRTMTFTCVCILWQEFY